MTSLLLTIQRDGVHILSYFFVKKKLTSLMCHYLGHRNSSVRKRALITFSTWWNPNVNDIGELENALMKPACNNRMIVMNTEKKTIGSALCLDYHPNHCHQNSKHSNFKYYDIFVFNSFLTMIGCSFNLKRNNRF